MKELRLEYDVEGDLLEGTLSEGGTVVAQGIGNGVWLKVDMETGEMRGFIVLNLGARRSVRVPFVNQFSSLSVGGFIEWVVGNWNRVKHNGSERR